MRNSTYVRPVGTLEFSDALPACDALLFRSFSLPELWCTAYAVEFISDSTGSPFTMNCPDGFFFENNPNVTCVSENPLRRARASPLL